MCVILCAVTARPSRKALELAAAANPDGAGVAWIEDGTVRFEKSMRAGDIIDLALAAPLPFIVHFRVATVGEKCAALCHPFPLAGDTTRKHGAAKAGVLFHNGTWAEWRATTLHAVASTGTPLGAGPLSDSRALAYMAARFGGSVLELVDPRANRLATLTQRKNGRGKIARWGDGWSLLVKGLYASNLRWLPRERAFVTTAVTADERGALVEACGTGDAPRLPLEDTGRARAGFTPLGDIARAVTKPRESTADEREAWWAAHMRDVAARLGTK